jgi:hypothetical protein
MTFAELAVDPKIHVAGAVRTRVEKCPSLALDIQRVPTDRQRAVESIFYRRIPDITRIDRRMIHRDGFFARVWIPAQVTAR